MSVFHDAYLFFPEEFAAVASTYSANLYESEVNYRLLRDRAISLFDSNSGIRTFAAEYGGWDRDAILKEIPADRAQSYDDIAFWLIILLYDHIKVASSIGLGGNWQIMLELTARLGWDDYDRSLLIRGRPFKQFALRYLCEDNSSNLELKNELKFWEYVRPFSTSGWAGWMDYTDVQRLLAKLAKDQSRISDLKLLDNIPANDELITKVIKLTEEMLVTANDQHSGLCIIMSG